MWSANRSSTPSRKLGGYLTHRARCRLDKPADERLLSFAPVPTVLADPVSSLASSIKAALRALHGHLGPLSTIGIAVDHPVAPGYWQLVPSRMVAARLRHRADRSLTNRRSRRSEPCRSEPAHRSRADDRYLDRRRGQRDHRLLAGAGVDRIPIALALTALVARPDLIRTPSAEDLRDDDRAVHRLPSGGARARLDYPDGRNRVETDRFNLAAAARRSRSAPRSWSPHASPGAG